MYVYIYIYIYQHTYVIYIGVVLTKALTGNLVYMAHHFILLWLNPFDLRVDREG